MQTSVSSSTAPHSSTRVSDPELDRLLALAKADPAKALGEIDSFKDKSYAGEVIEASMERSRRLARTKEIGGLVVELLRNYPDADWNRDISAKMGSVPILVYDQNVETLKTLPNADILFRNFSASIGGHLSGIWKQIKDMPWAEAVVRAGAESLGSASAHSVLYQLSDFADRPWAARLTKDLLAVTGAKVSSHIEGILALNDPELRAMLLTELRENPNSVSSILPSLARSNDRELQNEAIRLAPKATSFTLSRFAPAFEANPQFATDFARVLPGDIRAGMLIEDAVPLSKSEAGRALLDQAVRDYPDALSSYLAGIKNSSNAEQTAWARNSDQPFTRLVTEFTEKLKGRTADDDALRLKARIGGALLPAVERGELTIDQVVTLASEPANIATKRALDRELLVTTNRSSVEEAQKNQALLTLLKVNELHERPDAERFRVLAKYTAADLYQTLGRGAAEAYTTTFLGVFSRMESRMKAEGLNGEDLVNSASNLFRNVANKSATFGKLDELVEMIPAASRRRIVGDLVSNLFQGDGSLDNVLGASSIIEQRPPANIASDLTARIAAEYQKAEGENNKAGMTVYGLLASRAVDNRLAGAEALSAVAAKYQSQFPDHSTLVNDSLFDSRGINTQRVYFYNDEDGRSSFQSFLNIYKDAEWKTEDRGTYVVISSIGPGRKIEMYANKPAQDVTGNKAIDEYLAQNQITPKIVVHRGHSTHTPETIKRLSGSEAFVFLGSCGGSMELANVAAQTPGAQIIATHGEGTMQVNDPMLKMINRQIRNGEDINWKKTWEIFSIRFKNVPRFADYIRPDANQQYALLLALGKTLSEGQN